MRGISGVTVIPDFTIYVYSLQVILASGMKYIHSNTDLGESVSYFHTQRVAIRYNCDSFSWDIN
jgi:hypothetical protein